MRASLLTIGVVLLLAACSASSPRRSDVSEADLLSGDALGPGFVADTIPVIRIADAFALDEEMRAFAQSINDVRDPSFHVKSLLDAMKQRGLFALDYTDAATRTVSETFHERRGNCLSFTMLFIELARAVGLHARYQLVDVPPRWNHDADLIVIANHVNAVVESRFEHDLIVDFNSADFRGDYPTRKINDDYAAALYYTNLGAEALVKRDFPSSFALFREALSFHSDMAEPWVNLGVLYGRLGRYDYAEAAYLRALEVDPRQRSAVANLVGVYTALGDTARAEEYRERVRHYQDINPYYHYARAQLAYAEKRHEDALGELRSAIRLKDDDRDFYTLQGETLAALGRDADAARSFARARALARPAALAREGEQLPSSAPGRLQHATTLPSNESTLFWGLP
jgi:tetratricopeptide (TPR) repeat protein